MATSLSATCDVCDKTFINNGQLNKHKRVVHGIALLRKTFICDICENTGFSFFSQVLQHYISCHNFQAEELHLVFSSFTEFNAWKTMQEKKSLTKFIKKAGSKRLSNETIKHSYICHRSGTHEYSGQGLRQTKSQGSCKMGKFCLASMTAFEDDGKVSVTYQSRHYGHSMDIGHLQLSTEEKASVAAKLKEGVPMEAIMDDIRNNVTGGEVERILLITKKDMRNISRAYGINWPQKLHEDDESSEDIFENDDSIRSIPSPSAPTSCFHQSQHHTAASSSSCRLALKVAPSVSVTCDVCHKSFSMNSQLNSHKKLLHDIDPSRKTFQCDICENTGFTLYSQVLQHHISCHNFQVENRNLEFPSFSEFDAWKTLQEKKSLSKFIKPTGSKSLAKETTAHHFICHQSDTHEKPGKGLQQPKSQSSCQIGKFCLASIEAYEADGKVSVAFQSRHYGHGMEESGSTPTSTDSTGKEKTLAPLNTYEADGKVSVAFQSRHGMDESGSAPTSTDSTGQEKTLALLNSLCSYLSQHALAEAQYSMLQSQLSAMLSDVQCHGTFQNVNETTTEIAENTTHSGSGILVQQSQLYSVKKPRKNTELAMREPTKGESTKMKGLFPFRRILPKP